MLKGQVVTGSDHDAGLENTYKYSIPIGIPLEWNNKLEVFEDGNDEKQKNVD